MGQVKDVGQVKQMGQVGQVRQVWQYPNEVKQSCEPDIPRKGPELREIEKYDSRTFKHYLEAHHGQCLV